MRRRGRPPKQREEQMQVNLTTVDQTGGTRTETVEMKLPSIDRVMSELSKIVPPEPTPAAKAQALEAAAQAARNWYKDQVLRPDDSLPVDYVCRQIGNAIMALANRP